MDISANRYVYLILKHMTRSMTKPTKTFAPSDDSDQPGLLSSLIRVFIVLLKKRKVFSYR